MPVERSRGSRRTGADGNQLVWTEPALAPGIAFATNLTPGAFEESNEPSTTTFACFEPTSSPSTETKMEPTTPSPSFFFFDAPPPDESKPKRASHKRKPTPPPSSPSSPTADGATDGAAAQHIPRPPNAFILFRSSFIRAGAVPSHVEPSHASLSTIAGLTWSALPAPEKALWHRKAKEERERHRERFPGYAFRPKHRNNNNSGSDADCEDGGGGGGGGGGGSSSDSRTSTDAKPPRRRQQREVPPADRARQAHIASLLLTGMSGAALDEAIAKFDAERKERGEGGVEVRFGVVETPEGRVAASDKKVKEGSPCVKRSTSKAEKRRPSTTKQDGKRQRVTVSPSSPSPASSSPSSPVTDTDATSPFAFAFDALSMPSTPVDTATFEWPYTACFDSPSPSTFESSYPPSPALSHCSPTSTSASSSSWSSYEDLSLTLASQHAVSPSPLSACSSMSSLAGDLSLTSLDVSAAAECGLASVDMSMYAASLMPPPSSFDFDLGLVGFGGMAMGEMGSDMGFLTGYLEAPQTQADGIAAW